MLVKIAFRNILRNGRRSLMTASAIAVGAIAMTLFGEYNDFAFLGLQTQAVTGSGHMSVFKKGYFEYGSGNPTGYSIPQYKSVIALLQNDPVLQPMLNVVTPTVSLFGIAGNFSVDASKTFFGTGFVPSDRDKMRRWDEYHLRSANHHFEPIGLSDAEPNRGVVGYGMARTLGLCATLKVPNCPKEPKEKAETVAAAPAPSFDLAELASRDASPAAAQTETSREPRLDLLGATANGAPNVVSFYVTQAQNQGVKELDDMFVGMHIALAQELLYGRGEHKAVSIVLQLHRTEDLAKAKARIDTLIAEKHLDLEVRDFTELSSSYSQIKNFLSVMFGFLAVIMGMIVIFTVVNTMTMSVMERVNEIGTARAMGVRRSSIRRLFVAEGFMLGVIGATAGVAFASLISVWFNSAGIMYTPPGQSGQVPVRLLTTDTELLVRIWIALVVVSTLGALVPASRAAKMKVVDALRHV